MLILLEKHTQRKELRKYNNKLKLEDAVCSNQGYFLSAAEVLKNVFLPVGYPASVREEYLEYQFYDSLQAVCSYLRGVLCMQAVLQGSGVGSAEASALSAALVWTCRDGSGMLGSLVFAYNFAESFETYAKEWRLVADILNNVALTLDLVSSYFPEHIFLAATSASTICKACCGLCAGATKARISSHFSVNGCIADVTSKESTQETAVALIGLFLGSVCAKVLDSQAQSHAMTWSLFIGLLILHQYANWRLIRTLNFDTLNPQRTYLIVEHILKEEGRGVDGRRSNDVQPPTSVSRKETLLLPIILSWHGPRLGESISHIIEASHLESSHASHQAQRLAQGTVDAFQKLCHCWKGNPFIIGKDKVGHIIICLEEACAEEDVLKAYIVGCYIYKHYQQQKQVHDSKHEAQINEDLAKRALQFYDSKCSVDHINNAGWDVGKNRTKLSDLGWRYNMKGSVAKRKKSR